MERSALFEEAIRITKAHAAAITGLRDPLHEGRKVQPLDVLASADRDVRINAPRLLNALTFTTPEEALAFAETLRTHRGAIEELETLALQRAARLGSVPLPFVQET